MDEYIFYGAIARTDEEFGPYYGANKLEKYVKDIGGKVLFYVDADSQKWDEYLGTKENSCLLLLDKYAGGVHSPLKIKDFPQAKIVILCSARAEVCNFLRDNGINNPTFATPDFFVFPYCTAEEYKGLAEWTQKHEDEIRSLYETNDAITSKILDIALKQRCMGEYAFVPAEQMNDFRYRDYFYDETLIPREDITLVDGGAFTGDSIEVIHRFFGNHIKKIYAFEPDEANVSQLRKTLLGQKIVNRTVIVEAGMYDQDTTLYFSCGGSGGHFSENQGQLFMSVKKIDSIVDDVKGKLMIKMDIEGSEVAAIHGAHETILKYRPYMAICMYHKMEDILDVPKAIHSICPNYKFYIRGGTHYECYAVPMN